MRMHRRIVAMSLVVFAALPLTLASPALAQLAAQEALPAASPITVIELAPGVTAEVFAGAPSGRAAGQRHDWNGGRGVT